MRDIGSLVFWAVLIGALMYIVSVATEEFRNSASKIF